MALLDEIKYLWLKHTGKKATVRAAPDGTGHYIHTGALDRPDRNPSLSIYVPFNGRPKVKDFAKGDKWVDLLEYARQYNPALADEIAEVLRTPGAERPKRSWAPQYRPPQFLKERPFVPLSDQERRQAAAYRANLKFFNPYQRGGAYSYLQERLPYADATDFMRLADHGVGVDDRGNVYFASYLPDKDGRLVEVNYQIRNRSGEPRYRYLFSGHSLGLFICGNRENPKEIWIYEGPFDAITGFLEVQPEAMHIATHGASNSIPTNFMPMVQRLAEAGTRFVITGDRDEAGEKWRYEIINTLIMMGVPEEQILVAALDNLGRDINEQINDLHKNGIPREKVRELMLSKLSPKPLRRFRSSKKSMVGAVATTGAIGVHRAHRSVAIALGLGPYRERLTRTPTQTKAIYVLGLMHALDFVIEYLLPKRARRRLEKNGWLQAEFPKMVLTVIEEDPVFTAKLLVASVGRVEGLEAFRMYDLMRRRGLHRFADDLEWTKRGNEYCAVWAKDPTAVLKEFAKKLAALINAWEPPTEEEKRYLQELTKHYMGEKEEAPKPPLSSLMSAWASWRVKVRKLIAWFRLERDMFYGRIGAPSAVAVPVPTG